MFFSELVQIVECNKYQELNLTQKLLIDNQ